MWMPCSVEHLDAVAEARNRIEQYGGRRRAPTRTDDRMVRRDAEADPVFAQYDLVDDLAVADRKRRNVLLCELGEVGLGPLLAPGRKQGRDGDEGAARVRAGVPGHFALPSRIEQVVVGLRRFIPGDIIRVVSEPYVAESGCRPGAVGRDVLLRQRFEHGRVEWQHDLRSGD